MNTVRFVVAREDRFGENAAFHVWRSARIGFALTVARWDGRHVI